MNARQHDLNIHAAIHAAPHVVRSEIRFEEETAQLQYMRWRTAMICEFCGGQTAKKRVRKTHWRQGKLYLVEDVEAEVCRECGERYYHATTLDAIDNMLETGALMVRNQFTVQVVGMPA